MAGGAIVGGISGGVGTGIASLGIPMANTLGIAGASLTNSFGTHIYTRGKTPISMSIGVASYNFSNNEFGYLGNKGNSFMENVGYGLGALANVGDVFALMGTSGNVSVNSASTKGDDLWGHSSITDENNSSLVSVGPDGGANKSNIFKNVPSKNWRTYADKKGTWSVELNNVNTSTLSNYSSKVTNWNLTWNSCVGHTSRALWSAGIPNIYGFHPHVLNASLLIRQIGINASPFMY